VVIVGRGAGFGLRGRRPDLLHVRLIAPEEHRVAVVASRLGVPADQARKPVRATDRQRRDFVRARYHADWDDPLAYDITLNTATLGVELAIQLVLDAAQRCFGAVPASA